MLVSSVAASVAKTGECFSLSNIPTEGSTLQKKWQPKEILRQIVLTGSIQEIGQKGSEKSKQVFLLGFYTIHILCLLPWGRMSFLWTEVCILGYNVSLAWVGACLPKVQDFKRKKKIFLFL